MNDTSATISGIGCSSNLPGYISTYGMHTLHGRAVAVASGVQLGNHSLKVIATGGDGDGYGIGAAAYLNLLWASDAADKTAAAGTSKEMIVVFPDSFTVYNGSMYSNSPTTGNWETFITEDLISYIDSHYRTIASRESRGLAGHSMGGYGTLRIGMKYPEVYAAIYPMSSCCLMNNPGAGRGAPESR